MTVSLSVPFLKGYKNSGSSSRLPRLYVSRGTPFILRVMLIFLPVFFLYSTGNPHLAIAFTGNLIPLGFLKNKCTPLSVQQISVLIFNTLIKFLNICLSTLSKSRTMSVSVSTTPQVLNASRSGEYTYSPSASLKGRFVPFLYWIYIGLIISFLFLFGSLVIARDFVTLLV